MEKWDSGNDRSVVVVFFLFLKRRFVEPLEIERESEKEASWAPLSESVDNPQRYCGGRETNKSERLCVFFV